MRNNEVIFIKVLCDTLKNLSQLFLLSSWQMFNRYTGNWIIFLWHTQASFCFMSVLWALNDWCFWTVVLEKTLEKPLDCKQIKPVNPKGNQSWILMEDWCWSWSFNSLATWCKELTHWKRPWCWERLWEEEKGAWDCWKEVSLSKLQGVGDGQGSLACCSPRGHKEWDMTELIWKTTCLYTDRSASQAVVYTLLWSCHV